MPATIPRENKGGVLNATNLRRLRREAELTQTELANLAGITQGHLSRLETGQSICSSTSLRSLADILADTLLFDVGSVLRELTDP
jgi:transcriptional regulator with XRE-family HTH domain